MDLRRQVVDKVRLVQQFRSKRATHEAEELLRLHEERRINAKVRRECTEYVAKATVEKLVWWFVHRRAVTYDDGGQAYVKLFQDGELGFEKLELGQFKSALLEDKPANEYWPILFLIWEDLRLLVKLQVEEVFGDLPHEVEEIAEDGHIPYLLVQVGIGADD